MIRRASLRWRLVAWVVAVMLFGFAIVFVVVYEQTGSQLHARINDDARADLGQLSQTVRALHSASSSGLLADLRRYLRGQPYNGRASLMFAVVPGAGTASNHPELFGASAPDGGETAAEQERENHLGDAVLNGPVGMRSAAVPDVGPVRLDERLVSVAGQRVRLGAGEALATARSAQHAIARSFLIAGALAVALVLLASYLAGLSVSRPLRRMARVAERVDGGDLHPRMQPDPPSHEISVLANAFNHMLDRLTASFRQQRDFVADASHELRTPLSVISGQLDVLARYEQPSVEDVRRVQRLVAAEVVRTTRLVEDMLLLARSEQREFVTRRPVALHQFVTELWATTTAGAGRRFDLGPVPDGQLDADPDRLAQALRNLIDNAIAHTVEGDGRVALHTEALAGGRVRFTVTDDGPGIAPEERRRIFERFHRTDEARDRRAGGAGLGLAIVQAIVEAHEGEVRAVEPERLGARLELEIDGFSAEPGRDASEPRGPLGGAPRQPNRVA
ncbi:MAG TPA: ATP-binding protein [Solirubrobacteraceae bacterium]